MVCDLVAWDRMVRRLGRVNRRGPGQAEILVIDSGSRGGKTPRTASRRRRSGTSPACCPAREQGRGSEGQPGSIGGAWRGRGCDGSRLSPPRRNPPLYPALTRPLVEAWAMTTLTEHPGRPEVGPWLRGWPDRRERSTTVIWRRHLPVRTGDDPAVVRERTPHEEAAFFEAAAPADGGRTGDGRRARRRLDQRSGPAEFSNGWKPAQNSLRRRGRARAGPPRWGGRTRRALSSAGSGCSRGLCSRRRQSGRQAV